MPLRLPVDLTEEIGRQLSLHSYRRRRGPDQVVALILSHAPDLDGIVPAKIAMSRSDEYFVRRADVLV